MLSPRYEESKAINALFEKQSLFLAFASLKGRDESATVKVLDGALG